MQDTLGVTFRQWAFKQQPLHTEHIPSTLATPFPLTPFLLLFFLLSLPPSLPPSYSSPSSSSPPLLSHVPPRCFHARLYPSFVWRLLQNNLVNAMPDKFNDMVRLWNEATVHEVKSNYEAYDSDSVEVSTMLIQCDFGSVCMVPVRSS